MRKSMGELQVAPLRMDQGMKHFCNEVNLRWFIAARVFLGNEKVEFKDAIGIWSVVEEDAALPGV